ncbi:MAG: LysR family transcriptional regulator [Candidimonas sp.]|nr:MAG: LysR family transcriptional regulator [Candidimonas sp.]
MNVKQLEAFCKVIETGSMSDAGRVLGVSQPAISKSVRLLEKALKLTLFKRVGDHLHPTMEAQSLYPSARRIFDELKSTEELSRKLRMAEAGTLKLAATYAVTAAYMTEAISIFHRLRPLVEIRFMTLPPRPIIELAQAHEVEAGFLYEPITGSALTCAPVCETQMVCVLPLHHRLAGNAVIDLSDLRTDTIISFSENSYGGGLIKRKCEERGIRWRADIEVNQSEVAMKMVEAGIGTAVVDSLAIAKAMAGNIIVKPFRPSATLTVSVIGARDARNSRLCDEFTKCFMDVVTQVVRTSSGYHETIAARRLTE